MSLDAYAREIESQFRNRSKILARNFTKGIILYDKDGQLLHLQKWAKLLFRNQLPAIPNEQKIDLQYQLWKLRNSVARLDYKDQFFGAALPPLATPRYAFVGTIPWN